MARGRVVDEDVEQQVFAREVEDDEDDYARKPTKPKNPIAVYVKPIAAGARCLTWVIGMLMMARQESVMQKFFGEAKSAMQEGAIGSVGAFGAISIFFFTVAWDQIIRLSESFFVKAAREGK